MGVGRLGNSDWETQEGECCIHTHCSGEGRGKKRRKVLVWWPSHNLSVLCERKEKKFWPSLVKGSSISTGMLIEANGIPKFCTAHVSRLNSDLRQNGAQVQTPVLDQFLHALAEGGWSAMLRGLVQKSFKSKTIQVEIKEWRLLGKIQCLWGLEDLT